MAEHTLYSIAFPTLDEAQIAQLVSCTTVKPRRCADGEKLISVGERDLRFFIVTSGEIEIVDCSGDAPKIVAVHHKGQFTGDISHVTGMPSIISAYARRDCEVFEMSSAA